MLHVASPDYTCMCMCISENEECDYKCCFWGWGVFAHVCRYGMVGRCRYCRYCTYFVSFRLRKSDLDLRIKLPWCFVYEI
jgi:hypothetical protein